jgi:pyrroloquinoline-quinone synthase
MKCLSQEVVMKFPERHLLKHPFYQAWSAGKLTQDDLSVYARQYYHHVAAFPRYLSAMHSLCEDIEHRQVLLENLVDEERGSENHPELWLRFAEGLGQTREAVRSENLLPQTRALIDEFFKLSRSSYSEGLGALYAYEHQVPEIAATKIEGLKKFYGIEDERSVRFFEVHRRADVYHSQAIEDLVGSLSPFGQAKAREASRKAHQALWRFLDGMQEIAGIPAC